MVKLQDQIAELTEEVAALKGELRFKDQLVTEQKEEIEKVNAEKFKIFESAFERATMMYAKAKPPTMPTPGMYMYGAQ